MRDSRLEVLVDGVREGRRTFNNTLKYIFITSSANFGNMVSVAVASLFLSFLPLLPTQILLTNVLSDIPALTIAGDRVDQEQVVRPRRWDMRFIRDFTIVFGSISSAFDFLMFGLLGLVLVSVQTFRTAWFFESLLTELVVLLLGACPAIHDGTLPVEGSSAACRGETRDERRRGAVRRGAAWCGSVCGPPEGA